MNALRTLYFDYSSSLEERTNAANVTITTYNLPFNANDVVEAFTNLNKASSMYTLLCISFRRNLRMFIAILYALVDNKMLGLWHTYLFHDKDGYTLGCDWIYKGPILDNALKIWCTLYDYYEFDITDMVFTEPLRDGIQSHIDSKRVHTKPAVKVASLTP